MNYGKTIELFLVNGTADSITVAELSNWNGKAIRIPRIEISTCDRDDINQVGIYFLFCKEDDGSDSVYIGEAENVKERLLQHIRDYQNDRETYYWTTAIVFTGRGLNKALIRYLENRLVEIARGCKRFYVLTKNTYKNTVLTESEVAKMEEFIENVEIIINALGYKLLEPVLQKDDSSSTLDDEILNIISGTVNAKGKITREGFVLLAQSAINKKTSAKSLSKGMMALRTKIIESEKVEGLVTTEDLLFSSSSAAADFVLGYSVSGPQKWKTDDGRTLKELEENN